MSSRLDTLAPPPLTVDFLRDPQLWAATIGPVDFSGPPQPFIAPYVTASPGTRLAAAHQIRGFISAYATDAAANATCPGFTNEAWLAQREPLVGSIAICSLAKLVFEAPSTNKTPPLTDAVIIALTKIFTKVVDEAGDRVLWCGATLDTIVNLCIEGSDVKHVRNTVNGASIMLPVGASYVPTRSGKHALHFGYLHSMHVPVA